MKTVAILAVAGLAAVAAAQSITVQVGAATLNPGESTTITMLASFGADDFAMAAAGGGLNSTTGAAGLSNLQVLAPMAGPGTTGGATSPTGVSGIISGQLNFPAAGIFADSSNPVAFWSATYTAPAVVDEEFTVGLTSAITRFDVYIDRESSVSESRLSGLQQGENSIRVVPAPASLALLGLGGLAAARRRR